MTSYDVVYRRFLSKIEDLDFVSLNDSDQQAMLLEWLNTALSYIQFDQLKIKNDLSDKDDLLLQFNTDLENAEIEGIALYMVVAWYEPKVNSLEHTSLFVGSKDEKWSNQKDHYKATASIQDNYRLRARKYFRNHASRSNSYLEVEE